MKVNLMLLLVYYCLASSTHFILGQQGWEEVADSAMAWLESKAP